MEKKKGAEKIERKKETIERDNKRVDSAIERKAEKKTNFYAKVNEI